MVLPDALLLMVYFFSPVTWPDGLNEVLKLHTNHPSHLVAGTDLKLLRPATGHL
jgi:hypothetical protein